MSNIDTDAQSSDDEDDFCLFGMKGPIMMLDDSDSTDKSSAGALTLTILQELELAFLRKDEGAVRSLAGRIHEEEEMQQQHSSDFVKLKKRTISTVLTLVSQGGFVNVITSSDAVILFGDLFQVCISSFSPIGGSSKPEFSNVPDRIRNFAFDYISGPTTVALGSVTEAPEAATWRAFQVMLLGYTYFELFCQANYTGPEIDRQSYENLTLAATPAASCSSTSTEEIEISDKRILKILESDGNYAFPICELPVLLVIARSLLLAVACPLRAGWQAGIDLSSSGEVLAVMNDDPCDVRVVRVVRGLLSRQWLSCRVLLVHLRLLQKQSYSDNSTLFKEMQDLFAEAEAELTQAIQKDSSITSSASKEHKGETDDSQGETDSQGAIVPNNKQLLSLLLLEQGLGQHYFDYKDKGKSLFHKAIHSIGLKVKLTAAMGKRTKYQQDDHAQLLLLAKSNMLPDSGTNNLAKNLQDAELAMSKYFGGKKEKQEVVSKEWQHGEWELGKRVIIADEIGNEEVAIRDVPLDSMDGGAAENILLEEGVKFTPPSSSSVSAGLDDSVVDLNERHNLLHPLEQAVILALCLDISNSNPSDDVLTIEEMFPYLQSVLNMYHNHQHLLECDKKIKKKQEMLAFNSMGNKIEFDNSFQYDGARVEKCLNWMVYSTTLLERSFLEFEKRRTMDRAMMQIQALLDQHSTRLTVYQSSRETIEAAAPAHVRMKLLPCLIYPSQYEIKKDLAQRYLRCQVFNSALNLFTELEMWDEVVTCYQLLQKPQRAERLVRERLKQGEETPYMVCALADLTVSEEMYERSWIISGKRYGRAKRTLARICYDQGRFQECCDHLDESLKVQPLVPTSWYLKGLACMRIENYVGAQEAFTRCVQQDMEIGEAWGNLGAIHMHFKRYERAYECLIEAQKHRSREWRLAENLLTVCIETRRYGESLEFMKQLLDLRHSKSSSIDKRAVANNASHVDTTQDHPTPVHIPDLRKLCVIVALQTVHFVRNLDASPPSGSSEGDSEPEVVLPRLTVELENFLLKILTVMHTDSLYFELLIMYHEVILRGGDSLESESRLSQSEQVAKTSSDVIASQQEDSSSLHDKARAIGRNETWLRGRSNTAIRDYRLKQFRVLLNQPSWEKDERSVRELMRVGILVVACYVANAQHLSEKDFYSLRSMFKTAHARLEKFYEDSRQLEGPNESSKREDLDLLKGYVSYDFTGGGAK